MDFFERFPTFESWLCAVDLALAKRAPVFRDDLTDQPWNTWYHEATEPEEAVIFSLEDNGFIPVDDLPF